MTCDSIKPASFGSLVKKLQENNIEVSEDELSSLFSQSLSENGTINATDFAQALSDAYGIEGDTEILDAISQLGQNEDTEEVSSTKTTTEEVSENVSFSSQLDESTSNALISVLENLISSQENDLKAAKENNGVIAGLWDGFKNLFGIGASSNKLQKEIDFYKEQIEKVKSGKVSLDEVYEGITGNKLNEEELTSLTDGSVDFSKSEFLNTASKYQKGQKQVVDTISGVSSALAITGLITSGIFTGGISWLAAGAICVGAGTTAYMLPQAIDGLTEKDGYSGIEFAQDLATGIMSSAVQTATLGTAKGLTNAISSKVVNQAASNILTTEAISLELGVGTTSGNYLIEGIATRLDDITLTQEDKTAYELITSGSLKEGDDGYDEALEKANKYYSIISNNSDLSLEGFNKTIAISTAASLAAGGAAFGMQSTLGAGLSNLAVNASSKTQIATRLFTSGITGGAAGAGATFVGGGASYLLTADGEEINFKDWLNASFENTLSGAITGSIAGIGFEAIQLASGPAAPENTSKVIKRKSEETGLKYTEYQDENGNVIARDFNAKEILKYMDNKEDLVVDSTSGNSTNNARTIRFRYNLTSNTTSENGFDYQTNQAGVSMHQIDWLDNEVFLGRRSYTERIQYPTQSEVVVNDGSEVVLSNGNNEASINTQLSTNEEAVGFLETSGNRSNSSEIMGGINNTLNTSSEIKNQRKNELSKMNVDSKSFDYFYDLTEEEYKKAILLIQNNIMEAKDASKFAKLPNERLNTVLQIIDEEGEISDELLKLGELSDEEYEYFTKLLDKGSDTSNLKEVLKLDKDGFEKFKTLHDMGMEDFLSLDIIKKCNSTQYQRCIDLIEDGNDCYEAWNVAKLDDKKYERYEKAISTGDTSFGALEIARYDEARYSRYQSLLSSGMDTFVARKISKFNEEQISTYKNLLNSGLSEKDSYQITNLDERDKKQYDYYIENGLSPMVAKEFVKYPDSARNHLIELSKKGLDPFSAKSVVMYNDNEIYTRTVELLKNGVKVKKAIESGRNPDEYNKLMEEINSTPNAMRDFLNSDTCSKKIENATQGKYQQQLLSILEPSDMTFATRKSLLESGLEENDLVESIKKLSSSTFKLAMNTPNQYLSNIDISFTTKIDGKYPELSNEELNNQQKQITEFFSNHIGQILRALKYIDTDTLNQMMDKRTSKFSHALMGLDSLSDKNYELLSKLTKECKTQYTEEEKTAYIEKRNKNKKPLNETQLKNLQEQTTRDLTAKEKIELCQIVEIYQKTGIDTTNLYEMSEKGEVDLISAKQKIQEEILKSAGISKEELSKIPKDKIKLNEEYSYLLLKNSENIPTAQEAAMRETAQIEVTSLRTMSEEELQEAVNYLESEMKTEDFISRTKNNPEIREINEKILDIYKNIENYSDKEIYGILLKNAMLMSGTKTADSELSTVVRESVLGNFTDFINDETNIYGKTNAKTKNAFIENNIDYEQWLNPDIEDVEFELDGQKMTIKMWDRNPQEDLFVGNKTSCCTAIGTGVNGDATPAYLLNTSYNVVELYDETDEVVGMSRIFMANVDEKPALIVDNIELNSNYKDTKTTDDTKIKIRDNFFKYMNNLAKQITNSSDTNVYFCSIDNRVPISDLEHEDITLDFIGSLSQEKTYVNSVGNSWLDPTKLLKEGDNDFLVVPKNK